MARANFVKKARKDVLDTNIKAGDSYYWWKFRHGGKHYSKEPPKRWQLTQSVFYSTLWQIEDDLADLKPGDGLESDRDEIVQRLRDLADECQSSLDNMPEGLQQGDTGQMLQERIDACSAAADELENIDLLIDDKEDEETEEDFWNGKMDELQAVSIDAP